MDYHCSRTFSRFLQGSALWLMKRSNVSGWKIPRFLPSSRWSRCSSGQPPGPLFVKGTCVCTQTCMETATSGPSPFPRATLPPSFRWKARLKVQGSLPLFHVIFICLIKANLIKAGLAELRTNSSEHRSWPSPERGPLSLHPRAVASWQQGTKREGRGATIKEGGGWIFWGELD